MLNIRGCEIFKNKWDDRHTVAQKNMTLDFAQILARCVVESRNLNVQRSSRPDEQIYEEDEDNKKIGQWLRIVKGLEARPGTKTRKRAEKIKGMFFGSAIEEEAYYLLAARYTAVAHEPGDYTLETPYAVRPLFPHSFEGRAGGRGSRPDVRLGLGDGFEALFDITSGSKHSQGHILKKAGNWLRRTNIPFIAEIYYDPL